MIITSAIRHTLRATILLSMAGLKRGPRISRYSMYRHFEKLAERHKFSGRALSISGSEPLTEILGYTGDQVSVAEYPEANMLSLPYADETFDCVVSDQVLEHVEGDPQRAIDESFRVLKSGGIAVHTTCLINPIHGCPNDFWRFTPDALRLLCRKSSEIIDCGAWGNPYVWPLDLLGVRFQPVPEARWHPIHWIATYNDPVWPFVTWIVARK